MASALILSANLQTAQAHPLVFPFVKTHVYFDASTGPPQSHRRVPRTAEAARSMPLLELYRL
jgi:hypothetical protein